ncbi:putative T6SS immunity periplasmic lipoprotein [Kalamiella sp. sgz302252]|uniref:putative T6SS immunity periplasmic lipoprotein n=1 Tax=Pantoea sp. sgz302252 TaxID=3341827 RepID=UPI0036D2458A
MVISIKRLIITAICITSAILLSGCPWRQMKIYPDETATASLKGDSLCFSIPDASGYYPVFLSINPRNTPSKEKTFIDKPDMQIVNRSLCIPPAVYTFPEESRFPYIVEFILRSKDNHPRHFVTGFEIRNGKPYEIHLTDREIFRSQGKMDNK